MGKKNHKNAKKIHQTIRFYEKLTMPFHCRAVQVCFEKLVPYPKRDERSFNPRCGID